MLKKALPIFDKGDIVCITDFTFALDKFIRVHWELFENQDVLLLQVIPQVLVGLG
jgi:hypothetical protein